MTRHIYRNLTLIAILLAVVIWVDWPSNSGDLPFGLHVNTTTKLGLDLNGGMRVLLQADQSNGSTITSQGLSDTMNILENRVNGLGLSETTFQVVGSNRILAEFPGATNEQQIVDLLKETGKLAFVPMGSNPVAVGTVIQVDYSEVPGASSSGTGTPATTGTNSTTSTASNTATSAPTETATTSATSTSAATLSATGTGEAGTSATGTSAAQTPTTTATAVPTVYKALLTGSNLIANDVAVSTDSSNNYIINFSLDTAGTSVFSQYTSNHIGEYLAIVLDGTVISVPKVDSAITKGSGYIQGSFTYDTANTLAIQLRYGSLPLSVSVVSSEAVSATLGQDSVRKSIIAGVIGLLMVMLFMGLYYRIPGILADLALIVYALTNFAVFKIIPVTLTLPGIAGFVLSIGMAVDANVLIFERLKEELRAGRPLRQAIDLGWQRAWPSIRDSNISTLITCLVLLIFGSAYGASLVKGFAINLALGVLISLFTAVVVTRTFLHFALDNLKISEHPHWFGA